MKKLIVTMILLTAISFTACGSQENSVVQTPPAQMEEAEEIPAEPAEEPEEAEEIASEPAKEPEEADVKEESAESDASSEKAEWKTAYAALVEEWDGQHSGEEGNGFDLINIDDDEIPELAMFCDDDAWYAMDLYSFIDGEAKKLELTDADWDVSESPYFSPGWQGKGDYVCEKQGVYFQTRGMMGDQRTSGYRLENGNFTRIMFLDYTDLSWDEENEKPYSYILEYTDSSGKDISVNETITEDDDYSDPANLPQAKELEETFGFSFDNRVDLYQNRKSREEIIKLL